MDAQSTLNALDRPASINAGKAQLEGELKVPEAAAGIVIFAHGSGSSRHSPRNQFVARVLRDAGVGTLLFDLLTREEEIAEQHTRHLRFDIVLLAERLLYASRWLANEVPEATQTGFFGASTGAGAALVAAAELGDTVRAIVSRGGRPDLAGESLPRVKAATLFIVGGLDSQVITLNQQAYEQLRCQKELRIVRGAYHLFEERGTLEEVALLAADWFRRHFQSH
jgi:dienelactone hydrolase